MNFGMTKLKPCPCGKTPEFLFIHGGFKWAFTSGSCCNEWHIEFRASYHKHDSDECMVLAEEAWNEADRA